ncbi:MAG: DUF1835 domain-containing protein [Saprospiraceae bacterium]|nr:DUF1835 domain-containing protein [Saprospiraceae bacterium]
MDRFHIVNGDTTKDLLVEAGLKEPIIVWREMLCQGPVRPDIGSDAFWELRAEFLADFTGQNSKMYYYSEAVEEFQKINTLSESHSKIVLWFEHDLFCQINYIACLTYLQPLLKGHEVEIVFPRLETEDGLLNFSDYDPETVLDLLETKHLLTDQEVLEGRVFWHLWCQKNIEQMQQALSEETYHFPWLSVAIKMYASLLLPDGEQPPALYSYLSVKKHIQKLPKDEVIQECLTNPAFQWLGFGDLQYAHLYDAL